ncbi:MAG: 5-(carboxyamino)imidazole ribonucleotide synthase [Bradymonadia bacterium]|jgi:5-(carboxyamino)imidazole ribonucleotide synthase
MSAVVTPPVLGIFGGGQLGRMTTVAAQALGFSVRILDPDPHCPAATACDELITAAFDDPIAAQRLALGCHAVTVDLEAVGVGALEAAAQHAPVRPSADVLRVVQDRKVQREWLSEHGFPLPPLRPVSTTEALDSAVEEFGMPVFVKTTRGGYDGKGQVVVRDAASRAQAARMVEAVPCVAEAEVRFVAELSVQVARAASGHCVRFAPAWNHHVNQILEWSLLPAPCSDDVKQRAGDLATRIAEALDVVGLLTVELFLLADGTLWVNELAPRPHNSFHTTLTGTRFNQFDQVVRAVTGLPLHEATSLEHTVVCNLLGDLWLPSGALDVSGALAIDGVDVSVYGKRVARPGRKMGHLTATGTSPQQALERAQAAMQRFGYELANPGVWVLP